MVCISVLLPEADARQTAESGQSYTRQKAECISGLAAGFRCANVDLLSIVTPEQMGATETCKTGLVLRRCLMSDMWGWTDPQTDREYAIVGREDGTSFIDVTDPESPIFVGSLHHNGGSPSFWRDMKVYNNHVYIVADGSAGNGIQILDLTQLRDFSGTPITFQMSAHYDQIGQAHNMVINEETGFAYIVGASGVGCQGLYMLDISMPLDPRFTGCHMEPASRRLYTHDAQCVIYHGPDLDYVGREICLMANENTVAIADVTDKNQVKSISSMAHPGATYVHQGWLTEDHKYFVQNDELDELQNIDITNTRTIVWDVTDLDDPVLASIHDASGTAIDHNLYIKGSFVYQSNYTDGLHILDISDPVNPFEAGFFDTYRTDPGTAGFEVWNGTWSNYPFFKSGAIAVSSAEEGLLMVRPTFSTIVEPENTVIPDQIVVTQAYPNPFVDQLTLTVVVQSTQRVGVAIFNVLGQEVKTVGSRIVDANIKYLFEVDLSDLPPGTYFYTMTGETFEISKPITGVK